MLEQVLSHTTEAASSPIKSDQSLEMKFERLANDWRNETGLMSSTTRQAQHPAYQQIIAMGPDVVPFILRRLEQTGEQWFAALQAVTHTNPVKPEDRGNVTAMKEAWLAWAHENNYQW